MSALPIQLDWAYLLKDYPDLMIAKELAFVLRVSEKTIFSWQDLPRQCIRGIVRYPKAQVIEWLQKQDWPRPYRRGKLKPAPAAAAQTRPAQPIAR